MNDLYEVRRNNLSRLTLEKFAGKKAALARACDVHPNHVNLLLSKNPLYRRNLGEDLARRLESALGLPAGWMDTPPNTLKGAHTIAAHPIDASLGSVLKTSPIHGIKVDLDWLKACLLGVSDCESLFLATVTTDELMPSLHAGDTVVIDAGYKKFAGDGTYLVTSKGETYIRKIRKTFAGKFALSTESESETVDTLEGVVGRIVRRVAFENL